MGERKSWYAWADKLPEDTPREAIEEMLYDYQDHEPFYDDCDDDYYEE